MDFHGFPWISHGFPLDFPGFRGSFGACFDGHNGHPTPRIDQLHHPRQIDETSTDEGGHVEALNLRIFLWKIVWFYEFFLTCYFYGVRVISWL